MNKQRIVIQAALTFLLMAGLACSCSLSSDDKSATQIASLYLTSIAAGNDLSATNNAQLTAIAESLDDFTTPTEPATEAATEAPTEAPVEVRQWAEGATASSQWSDESGASIQAAGAPDVTECVDQHNAWASVGSTEVATLTLDYETPVIPTQINIYQTWNPDGVSQVEVVDINGETHTVYTGTPELLPDGSYACPYILTIDISDIAVPITQVVVTIDQTNFNTWNEIDAVELVGTE